MLIIGELVILIHWVHITYVVEMKLTSSFFFFLDYSGSNNLTPLLEGPADTSELYTRNLFTSTELQENIMEKTGPVLSFTLQLPQPMFKSGEPVTQPGEPRDPSGPLKYQFSIFYLSCVFSVFINGG